MGTSIRRSTAAALALASLQLAAEPPAQLDRVQVQARKRDESALVVPVSITRFSATELQDYGLRGFADYATKVPGLSFAWGNGVSAGETGTAFANARTIAIRGIAGARTTAYYLDDTPLPGAVDPRVLDLASIEVLKGPQGTLFGESSMGGTVRLTAQRPDLAAGSLRMGAEAGLTEGGGSDHGANGVANLVLQAGVAALRIGAHADEQSGWLRRSHLSNIADPASARVTVGNQAASRSGGLTLSGLLRATPALELGLRLVQQSQRWHGLPASEAPLPAFEPLREQLRTADIQPRAADRWTLLALNLRWRSGDWTLVSSTSRFRRQASDLEDSTEGTSQYIASYGLGTPAPQPFAWSAERRQRQLAHETRLSWAPANGRLGATLGLYLADLRSDRDTPPVLGREVLGQPGSTLLWRYDNHNRQQDRSVFGELYVLLGDSVELTLGERFFRLSQDDRTAFEGALYGVDFRSATAGRTQGHSPKLALAWRATPGLLGYASAAKGFRAGGAQADLSPLLGGCVSAEEAQRLARVEHDSLWSYELGAKLDRPEPGLLFSAALYRIAWDKIQQPAFVPACAFYLLGNAGAARIDGGELELQGRLGPGWRLRAGLGHADARITEQGSSRQPAGTPISQVPRWNATLGLVHQRALDGGIDAQFAFDASHVGASNSSNSLSVAQRRPGYALLNARTTLKRGRSALTLAVLNLGDARPNLGDLGYLGYLRFEADGRTPRPQVATLPPRRWLLQYEHRFD